MADLMRLAAGYGIGLTPEMARAFDEYERLLLEWSGKMNLTAIKESGEIAVKHFLDSLLLLKAHSIAENATIIDVGTGAGFPGVPVKIARPDVRLTLLDSLNKRVGFLRELSGALGQDNELIHGRAEQIARDSKLRGRFDLATARAVAALPALCEYCLPFVKVGGHFAALKGPDAERECQSAQKAIAELGGEVAALERFELPGGQCRMIVIIKKASQTPPKYPRNAVKISKTPL